MKEVWIREEAVCTERLGMPCLTQKSFQELCLAQVGDALKKKRKVVGEYKKPDRLQGVHNYDILANPLYAEKYHYIPCVYPNRDEYVISRYKDPEMRTHCVDLVRIVINLPYLKEEQARAVEFTPEYIETYVCHERTKGEDD